jgi:hypothetical protein
VWMEGSGKLKKFSDRTDPLKTTLVTSQLRHPLHSNGLLLMDQPTENPASRALQYPLHSNGMSTFMSSNGIKTVNSSDLCLSFAYYGGDSIIVTGLNPFCKSHKGWWKQFSSEPILSC